MSPRMGAHDLAGPRSRPSGGRACGRRHRRGAAGSSRAAARTRARVCRWCPRKEALAALIGGARSVAVSGTHGKTTTTVMTTEALTAAGLAPTGIAGGRVSAWGGNARVAGDDLFVVEADEYDKAFLTLHPTVAIVNNVEPDHLECYGSMAALEDAFVEFAGRAETAIVSADDPGARRIGQPVAGARSAGSGSPTTPTSGSPTWRSTPIAPRPRSAGPAAGRCPCGSGCRACTTCGTPWPRWPRPTPSAATSVRAAAALAELRRRRPPVRAAGRARRRRGGGRLRPPSVGAGGHPRRGAAGVSRGGGSWRCSSHTSTRAPRRTARRWARRWPRRTSWSSPRSTPRASSRSTA